VSDGIVECCDPVGREYGIERLGETILAHVDSSPSVLVEKILESVRLHAGNGDPQDDQTLLVFKVSMNPSSQIDR
jgi:serine phosphatase RsbU (regulator of sigma subunit)